MTTQAELDFDATVDIVANDWRSDEDWRRFEKVCIAAAQPNVWMHGEPWVDPNSVRRLLTNEYGLTIEPRRYSGFWRRAAGRNGFLDFSHWGINTDAKGRNQGKPSKIYRLRDVA